MAAKYLLKSNLPGELYVGIAPFTVPLQAPLQLQADPANPVTWSAPQDLIGGGRMGLGPSPYPYTTRHGNTVFATVGDAVLVWDLIPTNDPYTFLISTVDTGTKFVWTAGEPGQPITVQPITGEPTQLFTFVPLDQD